jgi:hypothetical protein
MEPRLVRAGQQGKRVVRDGKQRTIWPGAMAPDDGAQGTIRSNRDGLKAYAQVAVEDGQIGFVNVPLVDDGTEDPAQGRAQLPGRYKSLRVAQIVFQVTGVAPSNRIARRYRAPPANEIIRRDKEIAGAATIDNFRVHEIDRERFSDEQECICLGPIAVYCHHSRYCQGISKSAKTADWTITSVPVKTGIDMDGCPC